MQRAIVSARFPRLWRTGRFVTGAALLALLLLGLATWRTAPQPAFAANPTVTTISASPTSVVAGQNVTFTATVHCPPSGPFDLIPPQPTGTVTFTNTTTGVTLGSAAAQLTGFASSTATASFTTSFEVDSPIGSVYHITASYAGNIGGCEPSTSSAVAIGVGQANSTTLLHLQSVDSGFIGIQPILRVQVTPGFPQPTGFITFLSDTGSGPILLGQAPLDGGWVERFETPPLGPGTHSITAEYSGDNNYRDSTSAPIIIQVQKFPTDVAFTTFPESPSPQLPATQIGVQLSNPPGFGGVTEARTGTVQLRLNDSVVATVTLDGSAGESLLLTIPSIPVGTHVVTATYSGDHQFQGNSVSRSLEVGPPDDTTPPTTTATTIDGTAGANGWFTSFTVTIALSATDNAGGSGVQATYYTYNNGPQNTYTDPLTVAADGTHTIKYWSVDHAGNVEPEQTLIIRIDTVAPVVNCGPAGSGWHASNVSIPCTASDTGSGLDNPADASFSLTTSVPVGADDADASTNSRLVLDKAGHSTAAGPVTGLKVDRKAPTVVCAPAPSGWHADNVTVACTASDSGSGLANPADASFTLSTSVAPGAATGNASTGTRSICDAVGNCVTAGPIGGIQVDRQAPTTSANLSGSGAGGWYTGPVTVSLAVSDGDGSGVAATYFSLNGGSQQTYGAAFDVTGDGTHTITYWSVDHVGNIEPENTLTLQIDTVTPEVSCGAADGGWHAGNVTITCTASDEGSGLADPADASFTLSTDVAAGTVDASASTGSRLVCDVAGNCVTAGPFGGIQVDRQAPTTTATPAGEAGSGGWYVTAPTITLSADDLGSGVAQVYYRLDDGAQQTYSAPFTVGDGIRTIEYWSVDNVGNVEAKTSLVLKVDAAGPSCTATASPNTIWPPNRKLVSVTVTVTSTAGASGIASLVAGLLTSNEAVALGDIVGFSLPPTASSFVTLTGELRADRDPRGSGRLYAQEYTITNGAGVSATCTASVTVPQNPSPHR